MAYDFEEQLRAENPWLHQTRGARLSPQVRQYRTTTPGAYDFQHPIGGGQPLINPAIQQAQQAPAAPAQPFQPVGPGPLPGYEMFQNVQGMGAPAAPPAPVAPAPVATPGPIAPAAAVRAFAPKPKPVAPVAPGAPVAAVAAPSAMLDPETLRLQAAREAEAGRKTDFEAGLMGVGPVEQEAKQLRKEAEGWGPPNARMDYASQAARAIAGYKAGELTGRARAKEQEASAKTMEVVNAWKAAKTPKEKLVAAKELNAKGITPADLARYADEEGNSQP